MKTYRILTIIIVSVSLFMSACSSSPTTAPQSASAPDAPSAATPGYPAPNAPANNPPSGYPAPDKNASQPTLASYPAPRVGLKITAADGSAKMMDGSVLMTLVKSKVNLDGKDIEVRKLTDALKVAGITTFNKVSVNGANGTLALTKDQVNQAYLDIAADGSIQLAVQGMSKDKWIAGVQAMKVD